MNRDKSHQVQIEYITGLGWVHTHGMQEAGLPELEIRDIPAFLATPAANLLDDVCSYMVREGKRVSAGETMVSNGAVIRFETPVPMPDHPEHYEFERLQILEVTPPCECCGGGPASHSDAAEAEKAAYRVALVLEEDDDAGLASRLAHLNESLGGQSLGRRQIVHREVFEVEDFGFDSLEAAEAFAGESEGYSGVMEALVQPPSAE